MSIYAMKENAVRKLQEAEVEVALADRVDAWAKRMLDKLFENAGKGGPDGWEEDPPAELIERVREELEELVVAMKKKRSARTIYEEAADVANMVMMVADAYSYRMSTLEQAKKIKASP